jgi:hypothetical protein
MTVINPLWFISVFTVRGDVKPDGTGDGVAMAERRNHILVFPDGLDGGYIQTE